MSTKITVIYDNPVDPAEFEAGYSEQVKLARAVPDVQRIETSRVWPKEDGTATPAYRFVDLYFADYETASTAVTTDAAATFLGNVFTLATGGVRIAFADVCDDPEI